MCELLLMHTVAKFPSFLSQQCFKRNFTPQNLENTVHLLDRVLWCQAFYFCEIADDMGKKRMEIN